MCIIVYKPRGIGFPDMDIIDECFFNNSDGAGFMYRLPDGQIHIDKGFMSYKELVTGLSEIPYNLTNLDLVMHFRWATQGKVNMANTHPFPISNNPKDLKATRIQAHAGLVHNGIISFCTDKGKDPMSDTQLFVKDILSAIPAKQYRTKAMRTLIEKATGSKFIIMTRDDTILIGDFIEDGGLFYSNTSYKAARVARKVYRWEDYDWDKYSDYTGNYDRKWADYYNRPIDGEDDCDGLCENCVSFSCAATEAERQYYRDHREEVFGPPSTPAGEYDQGDPWDKPAASAGAAIALPQAKGKGKGKNKKEKGGGWYRASKLS